MDNAHAIDLESSSASSKAEPQISRPIWKKIAFVCVLVGAVCTAVVVVFALVSGNGPDPPRPDTSATTTHTCNEQLKVCSIGNVQERCTYLGRFAGHQNELVAGWGQQDACCKAATSEIGKKACFEHNKSQEFFFNYTQSYCLNDGVHSAIVWSDPPTYTKQPTHSLVADYYGGYVGKNKKHFNLTVPPEIANADFAVAHDACAVGSKWTYFLNGFASDTVSYGVGFEVLSPTTGCIVRQTATTGEAPTQDHAAGFIASPPNNVPAVGNPGTTYNKYLQAFKEGCAECISSLYAPDAKLLFTSSRGDTDWNKYYPDFKAFTRQEIKGYYQRLFAIFGTDYDVSPAVQDCGEANLAFEVPAFCYSAFAISSPQVASKYAVNIIFTDDGKIYGEGVVTDVIGIGERINMSATPDMFPDECVP